MKFIFSHLRGVLLSLLLVSRAFSQDDPDARCANFPERVGEPDSSTRSGTCTFDAFTGNQYREVMDLEVWGSVGDRPLVWMRYGNSRFGFAKNPYGSAHFWTSSYIYSMTDKGLSQNGQPRLEIRHPDGARVMFTQSTTDPSLWLPPPAVGQRLHQNGNNFFLQTAGGYRYRFEKLTTTSGSTFYRLQDFKDPSQNLYTLTYGSDNRLVRITEPAGRYLHITYSVINKEKVITKVQSSDGRSVGYHYAVINDGLTSWVTLDTVYYGDGTKASYEYSQREAGTRPLLSHAIDPRVIGAGTNMRYTYISRIAGMIFQEINGHTGAVMATFDGGPVNNVVCYANGNQVIFNLPTAQRGNLKTKTDGLGRKTAFEYADGGQGYLLKKIDALGRTTLYTRSLYGNLTSITHPDGSTESWTRDDLDLVLTYTDELNRTTSYTRDDKHRIQSIEYPDGTTEHFTYNSFGQVLIHTLRNKGVVTNTYNSRGLKTAFTDALGNRTGFAYDAADRLETIVDARGNMTKYTYNERGQVTTIMYADGTKQLFAFDSFGNGISNTNELGKTWKTAVDEFRRTIQRTDPLNRTTVISYDLPGGISGGAHHTNNPTKIVLPSGKAMELAYDVEWQMLNRTMGAGTADAATTFFEYDAIGNLVATVDPNAREWKMQYDKRDRRIASIDPLGNKTVWQYDAFGNAVKITRPDGGATSNEYDALNRLTTSTDPKGQVMQMIYDAEGNITQIKDPRNQVYRFEYDLLNRKTKMIYPDGLAESYSYDATGNLLTHIVRAGQIRTYQYDSRDREIHSSWTSPYSGDVTPAVTTQYDAAGRITSLSSTVSTLTYMYNDAGELISEIQNIPGGGGGKKVAYGYNPDGLRQSMTYPNGQVVNYTYTNRNQIASIIPAGITLVNYQYDFNGNRIGKNLQNGTTAGYTYDAAGRLLSISHQKGGASFASFGYGYDQVDRRTFMKRETGKGDVYTYDATDQVTKVLYDAAHPDGTPASPARTVSYDWDATGNRKVVTDNGAAVNYTTNNINQYTRVGAAVPSYFRNANLKDYNGWAFSYDAQNRLIKAQKGTMNLSFAYDARDRCVKRTINGASTFFYYDEWDLIEERNSSGGLAAAYVHGAQVDEVLVKAVAGNAVFYHHDALGSVTHLTSEAGTVVEQYSYDVFGAPLIKDGAGALLATSAFDNRFLFTGREYIQQLALYDYRHRMYSPELGRFIQLDPLRFDAGDINLYRYVANSPVNWRDPLGLGFWSSFAKGFVTGLVTAAVVVAAAVAVVTVVPAAATAVTATLFVAGVVSVASATASIIADPSADNIGYTLGTFTGAAVVGGGGARLVAGRLSPPGHQPPPGRAAWSLSRDASQVWRHGGPNGRRSPFALYGDFWNAMSTGPNVPSAAGAITATGGGATHIADLDNVYEWVATGGRPRNRCKR
jgi:RHS repeat-associated protein